MEHIISEIKIKYTPNKYDGSVKKITNSNDAYNVFLDTWDIDTLELNEEFKVLLLNNSNEVLGWWTMSKGGMTATVIDVKLLFSVVLKSCATGIITVHNHPSGNLKPSLADKNIYTKIKEAAILLDIKYLDNLIITSKGKYSFVDEGE
jgi:DNA repair protein RadC